MAYQSQNSSTTQQTYIDVKQQTQIYRPDQATPYSTIPFLGKIDAKYTQQQIQTPINDKARAVLTPDFLSKVNTYQDTTNYSFTPVKINATGFDGDVDLKAKMDAYTAKANALLEEAERDKKISQLSSVGSTLFTAYEGLQSVKQAHEYLKDVKQTASQYEAQKKIIDANIAKQESLMTDAYTENMAQAEAMYAGRNVDLSSEALTGVKQKGGIDLSRDITDIREQGTLQKSALDLDYAMNVRKAAQNERYTAEQATNATTSAIFNTALQFAF